MATIKAPSLGKPIYNGTHGNLSLSTNYITLASVAANDVIRFMDLPIGTRFVGARLSHVALGSGVSLDLKVVYADGTEYEIISGKSANTVNTTVYPFPSQKVDDKGPAELHVVVKGSTANGRIDVGLEYIAEGY